MEIYNGQPFFQIAEPFFKGGKNPALEQAVSANLENARQTTKALTKAIEKGNPIFFPRTGAWGDQLIRAGAYHDVLEKFCLREGIDPSLPRFDFWRDEVCSTITIDPEMAGRPDLFSDHLYYLTQSRLGFALGFYIDPSQALNIAQPVDDFSDPMADFSRVQTVEKGEEIRRKILSNAGSIVVVNQSGGSDEKRFSDLQVSKVVDAAKQTLEGSFVVVVSDKKNKKENLVHPFSGKEDLVVYPESANDMAPYFYASDTIITTDSFYGHLAAGSKVLRPDREGRLKPGDWLGLYTVALPESWAVPGGHIVESPALKWFRQRNQRLGVTDDVMHWRDYYNCLQARAGTGIQDSDLKLLLDDLPLLTAPSSLAA